MHVNGIPGSVAHCSRCRSKVPLIAMACQIPFAARILYRRNRCYPASGVDLTEIPGVNFLTAQMLLTEIGPNLDRFPTAAAFCSWLRLCPDPKISGGQVLSSRTRTTKNRAALALRLATQALPSSNCFLGDYFRRMKARMGRMALNTQLSILLDKPVRFSTRAPVSLCDFQ